MEKTFVATISNVIPDFWPFIKIYAHIYWKEMKNLAKPENKSNIFWLSNMEVDETSNETPLEMECAIGQYSETFPGKLMLISFGNHDQNALLMIKCVDENSKIKIENLHTIESRKITLKYR